MKKVFKIRVAPFCKPEELVGKVVVVCTNLEPKKIGGIVSNGMGDHTALCLSDDFFQS
jgi:tRNA-binding EMAP/Myf-like protein